MDFMGKKMNMIADVIWSYINQVISLEILMLGDI